MKKFTLIIGLFAFCNTLLGQVENKSYITLISQADSFYDAKAYLSSAQAYSYAFKIYKAKITKNALYDAACSWALCNNIDSAFIDLSQSVKEKKFYDVNRITKDADLTVLHNDKRWLPLIDQVEKNKIGMEAKLNMPLVKILDSILMVDQDDRVKVDTIESKYGYKSKQMDSLSRDMTYKDSLNRVKVEAIIDKYGWLGPEKIGDNGNNALFLVIQHSDIKTQEKYLPLMRIAVKEGKARGSSLALLEDRVALRQGKKQIYGSQVDRDPKTGKYSFFPIEDEPNVDNRREKVGLGPLTYYARLFNFDYQLPQK